MPDFRFQPNPLTPVIPRTSLMPITPTPVPASPGIWDYLREMAGRIGGPRYAPTGEPLTDVPPSPTAPPPPSTTEPQLPTSPTRPSAVPTPQFSPLSPMDFGITKTEGGDGGSGGGGWRGVPFLRPNEMPAPTPTPPPEPPISFGWGGNSPLPYTPGETSIADFAGAPTQDTFMGGSGTPGRGTLSVMNPPAYQDTESLYNDLERQRIQESLALSQRAQQDPFWQEREQADIWKRSEVGAQNEIAAAADKRIAETFGRARERLKTNPAYINPQNPDGTPVRDPESVRRDMESAIDAREDAARISILSGRGGRGSSPSMPGMIFR
jgi:hypothetical protein